MGLLSTVAHVRVVGRGHEVAVQLLSLDCEYLVSGYVDTQHHLLEKLCLLHWIVSVPLPKIRDHTCKGLFSGLSILLHESLSADYPFLDRDTPWTWDSRADAFYGFRLDE